MGAKYDYIKFMMSVIPAFEENSITKVHLGHERLKNLPLGIGMYIYIYISRKISLFVNISGALVDISEY